MVGKHPIAPKDSQTYHSVVKYDEIPETGESGRRPLPDQKRPPHRILMVEDDPDILCLNTEMLIRSGYHVDAAVNGAVAWDALQLTSYDLLITDHNMPELSGVKLLEKLYTAHMNLPVIMATGTLPEEFARCPWIQPAAMLLKPYTVEDLLQTVTKVLRAPNSPVQEKKIDSQDGQLATKDLLASAQDLFLENTNKQKPQQK